MENKGYHLIDINKGVVGELSKVYEEIEEVKDADAQGVAIMLLTELSDTIGAIESYLEKHHPTITIEDLIKMNKVTKRVFNSGHRG